MNSISYEVENNILSYLKTTKYKYVNKRFNDYSTNVENNASCIITRFVQKAIAEKKAIIYILNYKSGCKINANVCKQYIVKFYPSRIKQNALQYYLNRIYRDRVLVCRQHYMMPDTSSKIRRITETFCQYKEHSVLMFDMYDYFVRYKVMNQ